MNKVKSVLGLILISFCFLFIGLSVSAADLPQTVAQPVWPGPNPTQWYWYEPETNLTVKEANAIIEGMAQYGLSFIGAQNPNVTCSVTSLSVGPDVITAQTDWAGHGGAPYLTNIPFTAFQRMDLFYSEGQWFLKASSASILCGFFFKDENSARSFGNAVASIVAKKNLIRQFSKLGIGTVDLTSAQAEVLGKIRIDNAMVNIVAIDGPADKAGILPLDIITDVNGVTVKNSSNFMSLVDAVASGSKVKLNFLRREEIPGKDPKQFLWKPKVIEITAK